MLLITGVVITAISLIIAFLGRQIPLLDFGNDIVIAQNDDTMKEYICELTKRGYRPIWRLDDPDTVQTFMFKGPWTRPLHIVTPIDAGAISFAGPALSGVAVICRNPLAKTDGLNRYIARKDGSIVLAFRPNDQKLYIYRRWGPLLGGSLRRFSA